MSTNMRISSLWRLRAFVRPYRGQMWVMLFSAGLGVMAGTFVPLVIMGIVNGPIRHGNRQTLVLMSALVLVLGFFEAFLIFGRRWIQSVAVLKVEAQIRGDLYAHLQRLPVAFHDRWQTGQLLSRATTDLGAVRRFLGFGAIFLVVNSVQVTFVLVFLLLLYWPLGLVVAATMLPVVWLGKRFGAGYADVSRQVQDQQGDLATLVEEAATGIRVIKSFGRGPHMQTKFLDQARTLRESRPAAAAAPSSCGRSRVPGATRTPPSLASSPASRRLAPCLRPGGTMAHTSPPVCSRRTSSCIATVSRPGGMTAPVKMRTAPPDGGALLNGWPAAAWPTSFSRAPLSLS